MFKVSVQFPLTVSCSGSGMLLQIKRASTSLYNSVTEVSYKLKLSRESLVVVTKLLSVAERPTITTSFPMATNIPGSAGEEVKLTCIVRAKPSAQLTWKRDLNTNDLNSQIDDKVKSISTGATSIEMTVVVSAIDEEFYCVAVNLLGSDSQKYRIRERGE